MSFISVSYGSELVRLLEISWHREFTKTLTPPTQQKKQKKDLAEAKN